MSSGAAAQVAGGYPGGRIAAVIKSFSHEFMAWATTRVPWRDHATVTGDQKTAATFLDALDLT